MENVFVHMEWKKSKENVWIVKFKIVINAEIQKKNKFARCAEMEKFLKIINAKIVL